MHSRPLAVVACMSLVLLISAAMPGSQSEVTNYTVEQVGNGRCYMVSDGSCGKSMRCVWLIVALDLLEDYSVCSLPAHSHKNRLPLKASQSMANTPDFEQTYTVTRHAAHN